MAEIDSGFSASEREAGIPMKRLLVAGALGIGTWLALSWLVFPEVIRGIAGIDTMPADNEIRLSVEYALEYLQLWTRGIALVLTFGVLLAVLLVRRRSPAFARLRDLLAFVPGGSVPGMLMFAALLGLTGGLIEGLMTLYAAWIDHEPTMSIASAEVLWLAPLAACVSLTSIFLFLAAIDRLLMARKAVLGLGVILLIGLVTFCLIRAPRSGISSGAAAIFAIGAGVATSRLLRWKPRPVRMAIARGTPVFVAILAAWAVVVPIWRTARERSRVERLPDAGAASMNVVLVVWDAVRARNLKLYGHDSDTSPRLDQLAASATTFDLAFTPSPFSLPSHASLFTGHRAHEHSATWRTPLDDTFPTLAEELSSRGYMTAGFTGNSGYGSDRYGLGRGFVRFDDKPPLNAGSLLSTWFATRKAAEFWLSLVGRKQWLVRRPAHDVNEALFGWLERRPERPFFLFVNYFDAHEPYLPPQSLLLDPSDPPPLHFHLNPGFPHGAEQLNQLQSAYDNSIRYVDSEFGRLVDRLKDLDLLDNTVVIVTSDHGEEFGEHGPLLVGHATSLYRQSLRVPLVVRVPGSVNAGRRIDKPVSTRNVAATIAAIVADGDIDFPGTSLLDVESMDGTVISTVDQFDGYGDVPVARGDMSSLISQGLHLIRNGDGRHELYDMDRDPAETIDLATDPAFESRLGMMRALLDSLLGTADSFREQPPE